MGNSPCCSELPLRLRNVDHRGWSGAEGLGQPCKCCSPKPGGDLFVTMKALTLTVGCQGNHCLRICLIPQDRKLPQKNAMGCLLPSFLLPSLPFKNFIYLFIYLFGSTGSLVAACGLLSCGTWARFSCFRRAP